MSTAQLMVVPRAENVAECAAFKLLEVYQEAVEERGNFHLALSGGKSPRQMYELLRETDRIDWPLVRIYWGDERLVPPWDVASNERMAREALLNHVSIPEENVFPMYRPGEPHEVAEAYEHQLRMHLPNGRFDLVLLGLGSDGHTLSLFPGQDAVHETDKWVVASTAPVEPSTRITLTPPVVARARERMFLISGEDKADAIRRMLEGPMNVDETPSQAIARLMDTWVVLDEGANTGLTDIS